MTPTRPACVGNRLLFVGIMAAHFLHSTETSADRRESLLLPHALILEPPPCNNMTWARVHFSSQASNDTNILWAQTTKPRISYSYKHCVEQDPMAHIFKTLYPFRALLVEYSALQQLVVSSPKTDTVRDQRWHHLEFIRSRITSAHVRADILGLAGRVCTYMT